MFDVYDNNAKAETSKAGIIDAEARAYSALVQGKTAAVDAGIKKAEVAIQRKPHGAGGVPIRRLKRKRRQSKRN